MCLQRPALHLYTHPPCLANRGRHGRPLVERVAGFQGHTYTQSRMPPGPGPSEPVPWLWLCILGVLCCIHWEGAP